MTSDTWTIESTYKVVGSRLIHTTLFCVHALTLIETAPTYYWHINMLNLVHGYSPQCNWWRHFYGLALAVKFVTSVMILFITE